eukprot:COSAG03_NODE_548_length_7000_cov_2.644110_6_plen_206_part_00
MRKSEWLKKYAPPGTSTLPLPALMASSTLACSWAAVIGACGSGGDGGSRLAAGTASARQTVDRSDSSGRIRCIEQRRGSGALGASRTAPPWLLGERGCGSAPRRPRSRPGRTQRTVARADAGARRFVGSSALASSRGHPDRPESPPAAGRCHTQTARRTGRRSHRPVRSRVRMRADGYDAARHGPHHACTGSRSCVAYRYTYVRP